MELNLNFDFSINYNFQHENAKTHLSAFLGLKYLNYLHSNLYIPQVFPLIKLHNYQMNPHQVHCFHYFYQPISFTSGIFFPY